MIFNGELSMGLVNNSLDTMAGFVDQFVGNVTLFYLSLQVEGSTIDAPST